MKIAIVGAGFVGGATGRGFLKHNHSVIFVDTSEEKVDVLKEGGFEAYLASEYDTITTDVTMVSVPTPTKLDKVQLNYLAEAIIDFAMRLKNHTKYHTLVIRSTVPPGTTSKLVIPSIQKISGKEVGKDFGVVMQPEYLREVTATEDFERPWLVLIGEYDEKSGAAVDKLYQTFDVPIQHCSLEEAEMQKYVHNVYNAVKIAFFNEMRIAINHLGGDAEKIFLATAESCEGIWNPVYGMRDLGPFDGSCLPKDTRALLEWGEKRGINLGILRAVLAENLKHESILGTNDKVRVNYLANIKV
ncbi:MAG: hypothetical protein A3B14_01795 [Candidatus Zambryskibacteria bacterium RIFCSPLOWO2_01_FULL_45_21]|uniref:UDP-glucose 6-dehydrogenase n=1 Tax=Candidatus Zambryskibacteria bacterium RIFCSPLOWO2_01_FULL_45_21 TaxID=1802761 RepID=A0A1G2U3R5_9BACT|nr:MAG: hypothetical protein A3B14_01795 [Candidatus Zambryskibacteria bacterium RIFCSPLOWO2_01_FULL_45_21]